jgi:hypothetical protein
VGRAILYVEGAFLELVAVFYGLRFRRHASIRHGVRSRFLIEMLAVLGNRFARATGLSCL